MKYLEYYKKAMKTGKLLGDRNGIQNGLCRELSLVDLEIFSPTCEEETDLLREGLSAAYWGSGLSIDDGINELSETFTPLRQTIVLFLAAIHGELKNLPK